MFSIVIPLFNKEKHIQDTLDCVFKQTFNQYEIIVVDDGSTDNSVKKVLQFKNTIIRLIKKENGGSASARNTGIEHAKFQYIAFLDADDFWDPEYLAEQNKLIRDFPDAAMWGHSYGRVLNGKKILVEHGLPNDFRGIVENYFALKRKTDFFHTSSIVIPKSVFEKIGYFDTRIKGTEDTEMWFRIISMLPVAFCNKTYGYHNIDADNRIMLIRPALKEHISCYIGKLNNIKSEDDAYFKFINEYAAVKLLYYYFDSRADRILAKKIIHDLDFTKIKYKYLLMFKLPYFMGFFIHKLIRLKKWIFSSNCRKLSRMDRNIEGTPLH